MCNLESSQDGQIPNDKLDDGACAVPVDEIADSAVPFNVKKDMQMAWGDIETRRRNLDCKRDKLSEFVVSVECTSDCTLRTTPCGEGEARGGGDSHTKWNSS